MPGSRDRGQQSLEMLLLSAAALGMLALVIGPLGSLLSGSRNAAARANALSVLEHCRARCYDSMLSGSETIARVRSASEGRVFSRDGRVYFVSRSFNVSLSGFGCRVDSVVRKGVNRIVVRRREA